MVVALVNDPSLIGLIAPMGIDAYVNPRATTVSSILRYVRHGRIRSVYAIGDGEAEVIEAQVLGTSAIAGKTVREADMPDGGADRADQEGRPGDRAEGRHAHRRGRRADDLRHARLGRRRRAAVPGRPGLLLTHGARCASFRPWSILMLIASALMLIPALHAARLENWLIGRTFLYHGLFFAILAVIIGLALANRRPRNAARYHLTTLLLAYVIAAGDCSPRRWRISCRGSAWTAPISRCCRA